MLYARTSTNPGVEGRVDGHGLLDATMMTVLAGVGRGIFSTFKQITFCCLLVVVVFFLFQTRY